MEDTFKPVQTEDILPFVDIVANAYPGLNLSSKSEKDTWAKRINDVQQNSGTTKYYGLYRNGVLLAGARLFDFRMNFRSRMLDAGGIGLVAVDIVRKKEHAAKHLVHAFLQHYRERKAPIALLYAFRTDFYQQMGFGFGPQMYQYRLPPGRFPKGTTKAHVRLVQRDDKRALHRFYTRLVETHHGLMEKSESDFDAWFDNEALRILGYFDGDDLRGYFLFTFKPNHPDNFGSNNMHVRELFYDSPTVCSELLAFLHSQADQIRNVVLTTPDAHFYQFIADARNDSDIMIPSVYHSTNVAGVGLMYRVIDCKALFTAMSDVSFGGQNCTVKFQIKDEFLRENDGAFVVKFSGGKPVLMPEDSPYDVAVAMDVARFSSLVMGVVPFHRLLSYGMVSISDNSYANALDQLFHLPNPPLCTTAF